MKKYIVIPDFAPLYAMRKVFGPQTGPIRKPIPVDTKIIRELLKQKPPVRVLEVKLTNAKLKTYEESVELNLSNYERTDLFDQDKPSEDDKEAETTPETKSEENSMDAAAQPEAETEQKLEEPIASDAMGVELRSEEATTSTEVADADIAAVVDAVTTEEATDSDSAATKENTETAKSEDVAGAAETTKPLTRAQRRAMARAQAQQQAASQATEAASENK